MKDALWELLLAVLAWAALVMVGMGVLRVFGVWH